MFSLEGPSFGKSQLLNGAKLVNQNNNKWREISKSLINDSAKAKIFDFRRQKTYNRIFGDFHTLHYVSFCCFQAFVGWWYLLVYPILSQTQKRHHR